MHRSLVCSNFFGSIAIKGKSTRPPERNPMQMAVVSVSHRLPSPSSAGYIIEICVLDIQTSTTNASIGTHRNFVPGCFPPAALLQLCLAARSKEGAAQHMVVAGKDGGRDQELGSSASNINGVLTSDLGVERFRKLWFERAPRNHIQDTSEQ